MDNIKRLGTPLLVLILAALITRLMNAYMHIPYQSMILLIIEVTSLFLFGMFLNKSHGRRNGSVFKKVFAIVFPVLFLFLQLGFFSFDWLEQFLYLIGGTNAFYIKMMYIYCGYLFGD